MAKGELMPIYQFIGTWSGSNEDQRADVGIKTAVECFHSDINDLRVFCWRESGSLDWRSSFVFRAHPYRFDGPIFKTYSEVKGHLEKMLIVIEITGLSDMTHHRTMAEFLTTWKLHLSALTGG